MIDSSSAAMGPQPEIHHNRDLVGKQTRHPGKNSPVSGKTTHPGKTRYFGTTPPGKVAAFTHHPPQKNCCRPWGGGFWGVWIFLGTALNSGVILTRTTLVQVYYPNFLSEQHVTYFVVEGHIYIYLYFTFNDMNPPTNLSSTSTAVSSLTTESCQSQYMWPRQQLEVSILSGSGKVAFLQHGPKMSALAEKMTAWTSESILNFKYIVTTVLICLALM